ncbi:GNAT family N-acetyltransferase [Pseudooceanicola nanhaiensis]|uniref:GNAT family N-acetyltransferase n=1 Tax=Pseudooceanicola nanhaiensis TaxID=375761 RepID=UPI001CD1A635|nr:GNAT family N-acetyltransferase [Pseudooceanicola nanhaiensis]MCA0921160.1 GNAT family N-acetyltransferase [Pseudooceanicola nanhaiensis]
MTAPLYRTASAAEVGLMLEWAAEEGWNPGADDAAAFHAADPQGFFVAEIRGIPVAAISVVVHSETMAFLGLYLCRPEYRGRGIGYALWTHALKHAGGHTVGLDGVAAQQANYAKSGFVLAGSTTRYEGRLDGRADAQVRPLVVADAPAVARLDLAANGYARPAFLLAWMAKSASRQSYVMEERGQITGFATLRRCHHGAKIGPVIATDAGAALQLVRAALADHPATPVIIDLPEANAALAEALSALGFEATFATARMYRGPAPQAGPMLQAIATMELG